MKSKLIVWIAQGFGVGRIPFAPGTWGSVLGVVWWWILLLGGLQTYVVLTVAAVLLSVPVCAAAERILGQKDPGSVVLDEIVAMPLVWMPVLLLSLNDWSHLPWQILHGSGLWKTAAGFVAFRVFDIWKPWPIRASQRLNGGWGVVADDVLAALVASWVPLGIWWWQVH